MLLEGPDLGTVDVCRPRDPFLSQPAQPNPHHSNSSIRAGPGQNQLALRSLRSPELQGTVDQLDPETHVASQHMLTEACHPVLTQLSFQTVQQVAGSTGTSIPVTQVEEPFGDLRPMRNLRSNPNLITPVAVLSQCEHGQSVDCLETRPTDPTAASGPGTQVEATAGEAKFPGGPSINQKHTQANSPGPLSEWPNPNAKAFCQGRAVHIFDQNPVSSSASRDGMRRDSELGPNPYPIVPRVPIRLATKLRAQQQAMREGFGATVGRALTQEQFLQVHSPPVQTPPSGITGPRFFQDWFQNGQAETAAHAPGQASQRADQGAADLPQSGGNIRQAGRIHPTLIDITYPGLTRFTELAPSFRQQMPGPFRSLAIPKQGVYGEERSIDRRGPNHPQNAQVARALPGAPPGCGLGSPGTLLIAHVVEGSQMPRHSHRQEGEEDKSPSEAPSESKLVRPGVPLVNVRGAGDQPADVRPQSQEGLAHLSTPTQIEFTDEIPAASMVAHARNGVLPFHPVLGQKPKHVRRRTPRVTHSPRQVIAWKKILQVLAGLQELSALDQAPLLDLCDAVEAHCQEEDLDWWLLQRLLEGLAGGQCDLPFMRQAIRSRVSMESVGKSGTDESQVSIVCGNITTWRKEVGVWLLGLSAEVALLQETHVLGQKAEAMKGELGQQGWHVHEVQGVSGKGSGVKGGLCVCSKKHRNVHLLQTFGKDGCGYVAVGLRLRGWHLALVSLYLQDSSGLSASPNSDILAHLFSFIKTLKFPWLVAGDFNVDAEEIRETTIPETLGARVVRVPGATVDSGRCLDFALVSRSLESLVHVRAEWEVPWRPHAALHFTVSAGLAQVRLPQLARFGPKPEKPMGEYKMHGSSQVHEMLLEEPSSEDGAVALAGFSEAVETYWWGFPQGRGTNVKLRYSPLVPKTLPGFVWGGKSQAYWGRIHSWASAFASHRHTGVGKLLKIHLASLEDHWLGETDGGFQFRAEVNKWFELGCPTWQGLSSVASDQFSLHKRKVDKQSNASFKAWLEKSQEGSMRPLFKSIRKAEAVSCRPFLDKELRVRPFLRRQYWFDIWCPQSPGNAELWLAPLAQKGKEHAASLAPLQAEALQDRCQRLPKKAGGPDGWSYEMLSHLPCQAYSDLASLYRSIELSGQLPQQMLLSQYAMLPKGLEAERPIGLSHILWRVWCHARWGVVHAWLTDYLEVAVWDAARPGRSCLETAVRRLIRAEQTKCHKKSLVTIFVDLRQFYERVCHESLVSVGEELGFPPLLLSLAVQLYRGPRYVDSEATMCLPISAHRGLMAGCPLAPILAKLAIHKPLKVVTDLSAVDHADTWIDDISLDVTHEQPHRAAAASLHAFRTLRTALAAEGLEISETKTSFVCSDPKTAKVLKSLVRKGDPAVRQLGKDLGIDSGAARRRRTVVRQQRAAKGLARHGRLKALGLRGKQNSMRLVQGSILPAALWGHQAQGISPARMKWVRSVAAGPLGRQVLGSVDAVMEMHAGKVRDPYERVVTEHMATVLPLLQAAEASDASYISRAWAITKARLDSTPHRWKVVSGPVAALQAYMADLGVDAPDLSDWEVDGCTFRPLQKDPEGRFPVIAAVQTCISKRRQARLASQQGGGGAEDGLDWTVPLRLEKSLKHHPLRRAAHRAVWQGAVASVSKGLQQACPHCKARADLHHVLLSCPWWLTRHRQPPKHWDKYRQHLPFPCLWQRGLMPLHITKAAWPEIPDQKFGILHQEGRVPAEGLLWGTDASGGPSRDKRARAVSWAVVAMRRTKDGLEYAGHVCGILPPGSSVFTGEAHAVRHLLTITEGRIDCTCDCLGLVKLLTKAKTLPSFWTSVQDEIHRLHITWVNSHLSVKTFTERFGEESLWRREINNEADSRCQVPQLKARAAQHASRLRRLDGLVLEVNSFLAERVAILMKRSKQDPPPWNFQPGRRSKDSKSVFVKTGKPNKREQLKAMVEHQTAGHTWIVTSTGATNLTIRCQVCKLYIQQGHQVERFALLLAQPCIGRGPMPCSWDFHPSHSMSNQGKAWVCSACSREQHPGQAVTAAALLRPCAGASGKRTILGRQAQAKGQTTLKFS